MVAEPHKELRFTRAAQAVPWWIASAVALMAALSLGVISFYRAENPALPHPAWALVPLVISLATARLALHLTRHAYLILSPLGLEVFPFFRPSAGFQLIPWGKIHHLETRGRRLTLRFDAAETSGIHLSLAPVPSPARPLLIRALEGRSGTGG